MKLKNGRPILQVTIYGRDNSYTGEALIDTGAAFLVIPPSVDEQLGLETDVDEPTVKLSTASGIIEVEKKIIPKIKIGELVSENIPAVIHELPEPVPIKVLIGMNFLMRTKLTLDGKNKEFDVKDL